MIVKLRDVRRVDLNDAAEDHLLKHTLSCGGGVVFDQLALEPTEQTAAAVLDALTASGGDYTALISAAAHDPDTCTAVWWTLAE